MLSPRKEACCRAQWSETVRWEARVEWLTRAPLWTCAVCPTFTVPNLSDAIVHSLRHAHSIHEFRQNESAPEEHLTLNGSNSVEQNEVTQSGSEVDEAEKKNVTPFTSNKHVRDLGETPGIAIEIPQDEVSHQPQGGSRETPNGVHDGASSEDLALAPVETEKQCTDPSLLTSADISDFLRITKMGWLTDEQKLFVLDTMPGFPRDTTFPANSQHRRFKAKWMDSYPWLVYSPKLDGCFCRICFVWAQNRKGGKGRQMALGALVRAPFSKWKNALECFAAHGKAGYHKDAKIDSANFKRQLQCKRDF